MSIYRSTAGQQEIRHWCQSQLDAWGHPHQRRTVPTTLGMSHVVTTGAGPPIVMLAGTNFGAVTWLRLVEGLSLTHRVHAIDLPGQPGLSDARRPRHARRRYAAWLEELLPLLGCSAVAPIVVGHSLGAVVALTAAARGTPMAGLVLLDPAGLMRLRVSASVMRATLPWLRRPDADSTGRLLRMLMAPAGSPSEGMVSWMTLVGRHVRTSLAPPPVSADELLGLTTPVRILSGRHDAFLPPDRLTRAARRRLPDADLVVVQGAGHLLPHERPDVVADAIRSLSTRTQQPPTPEI